MKSAILKNAGINYNSAMARFHNNEAMYFKYLFRIPEDTLICDATNAFDNDDVEGAKIAVHTLKGLLGNLSMDELYVLSNDLVALLRADDFPKAKELFSAVFLPKYQKTVEVIKEIRE